MVVSIQKLLIDSQEAATDAFFLGLQLAEAKYCFERDIRSISLTYPTPKRIFIRVQEPLEFLDAVNSEYIFGCDLGIVSAILSSY